MHTVDKSTCACNLNIYDLEDENRANNYTVWMLILTCNPSHLLCVFIQLEKDVECIVICTSLIIRLLTILNISI